jgi:choline dehydrogenase-like flavoprotein
MRVIMKRVDVCIVGAGASGATAAKVLTEAGLEVVALERGPHLRQDQFSGDELKYINRNYLWPDPALKPRTYRPDEDSEEVVTQFSPTPQAVGAGTLHWGGNIPRITPDDFRLRSLLGDIPGASLADWPITYDDLEPYLTLVEYELGAAGLAGASPVEGRRSKPYPNPPARQTNYGRLFAEAMATLGHSTMPIPHAMLTRASGGRPANPYTGFWQQYADPTGSKSSAANTFIPDALATGRYDLRTGCYVKTVTARPDGRAKGVMYEDAAGVEHEQEATLVLLCCGGIETARLLLLSELANSSGQVGRNCTFHEDLYAVGLFDRELHDPVYGWSGNYMNTISFDFYATDESRGHVLGGYHFASMLGHPINWTFPGRPTWGQAAKDVDRDFFNHSLKLGYVLHDLPRETNRVDLSDKAVDAWGLPVARITHTPHPNDYAQGRWHIDKNVEILEAAGACKVYPVGFDHITGNCCHELGTARMGPDPETSVVDAWGRAHDVPNLYVLDGSVFPTACGVTPTLTIMANAWRCCDRIVRERDTGAPSGRRERMATP